MVAMSDRKAAKHSIPLKTQHFSRIKVPSTSRTHLTMVVHGQHSRHVGKKGGKDDVALVRTEDG